jgi:glycosyltransferase involved in cell wall biosynthesis
MEKISVIVPVYKVEAYLKTCVNSIQNQTFQKLEIILVDDGSPDNSGKICDELAKNDSRIKVIHKKNGGLSNARNEALKIATGDYIGFVDSDDCIIPEFYEYLYSLIKKHNTDISQGNFLRISSEYINDVTNIIARENEKQNIIEKVYTNKEALDILYDIKEDPYVQEVVVWNKLYKKEIFENITFKEGKLHEDEFTTHKILYNANNIVVSTKYIYGYMQTKNSIMRQEISLKRIEDNLGASLSALEFFENKGVNNLEYKIALRYLENCIELSGKIAKEESLNKTEKLGCIEEKFFAFYNQKINIVEKSVHTELEKQTLNLIKKAYNSSLNEHNLSDFWNELMSIIK